MLQDFVASLNQWNSTTTERQKLQHAYIVLLLVIIFVAGLAFLLDITGSVYLTYAATACLIAYLANAVIWHLLNSSLLSKLSTRTKKK